MIPSEIDDDEFLYRRIINQPNFWKPDLNRHTSAAFKQSNGLSVDRNHERTDSEVIDVCKSTDIKAISKIKCKFCRSIPTFPIHKPIVDTNIYHSEIHNSEIIINLTQKQYKELSKTAIPIWINEVLNT
jgi:hypothetical protein